MDQISINIPEGMDEEQRAELVRWFERQAELASPKRLPCEDDPEWHAEAVRRIKRGLEDIKAGRVTTSDQIRRELDAKLGISPAS